jgi:transcriptional regulator with GAF, ATPase, and Fis domain
MPVLRVIDGPSKGSVVILAADKVTLGRDQAARLPLNDAKSSRIHAEVAPAAAGWQLKDLNSSNGTWGPNGRLDTIDLVDGFTFRIGASYIRFELDEDTIGEDGRRWSDPQVVSGLAGGPAALLAVPSGVRGSRSGVERANAYLALLHQIVLKSNTAQGRDALFELLDDAAAEALEGDRCAVFLPSPVPNDLGGWTLWPAHERRLRARYGAVPFARTLLADVRQRREPLLCTIKGDVAPSASMVQSGVSSAMAAPLRIGDEIHALLYVDRIGTTGAFSRTELEFLAAVANQLAVSLHNRERVAGLEAEVQRLAAAPRRTAIELIGDDPAMQPVRAFIDRAGPTPSPVLVFGESGTGKELVARAIHQHSQRADRPLQVVNCAAIAETLVESTLFGHVKGAFTGANETRPGVFELADQATLFLDEVGELPLGAQAKLLRALEQGEVQRVGDSATRKVDVRLIAATNRVLADEVKAGRFREDLLHRLDVLSVVIPPLRERPADIDRLADHFLHQCAEKLGQPVKRLAPEARAALLRHPWPGNVRQLRNVIERTCVLASNEIIAAGDLPVAVTGADVVPVSGGTPITSLSEIERLHITRVLDHCGGNKKAAAEILQIDRSTLYAKLRQYETR